MDTEIFALYEALRNARAYFQKCELFLGPIVKGAEMRLAQGLTPGVTDDILNSTPLRQRVGVDWPTGYTEGNTTYPSTQAVCDAAIAAMQALAPSE